MNQWADAKSALRSVEGEAMRSESVNIAVSIIVPVYNSRTCLRQCLNSLVMQTLQNIEIICVDDGSTDDSLDILREYAAKDVRIKIFARDHRGVSEARNCGIKNAAGEYIEFVDSDDYIEWDTCATAYGMAKEKNADIVVFGGFSFPTKSPWAEGKLATKNIDYLENSFDALFNETGSRPFCWNKIYKRSLFLKNKIFFSQKLVLGEDQALLLVLLPYAKKISYIDKKLYHYRQSADNSAMLRFNQDLELKLNERLKLVQSIHEEWQERGLALENYTYLANWIVDFLGKDIVENFTVSLKKAAVWIVEHLKDFEDSLTNANRAAFQQLKILASNGTVSEPIISVVMPVYNAERWLIQSLNSILFQTFTDFELICADDGSDDSSPEILKEYAAADKRIKILTQENKYAGVARNYAMSQARGKYIIFLDADDFFEPTMLEDAYRKIEETDAEICIFASDIFDQPLKKYSPTPWTCRVSKIPAGLIFSKKTHLKDIYQFTTPAPWNKLYRRDFIEKYNLRFQATRSANDMLFVMTSLSLADKIVALDKVLLHYRKNAGGSLQSTQKKNPLAFYEALIALRDSLISYGVYAELEQPFKNFALDSCLYNLGTLKDKESFEFLFSYLRDKAFKELDLERHSNDYYYAYPSNKIYQKMIDVKTLTFDEYVEKYELCAFMTPKVSVILPSLNVSKYMSECLASACAQTLKNIEIICVDAGSTDGTLEIIKSFAAKDGRIRLIVSDMKSYGHQMNLGLAAARGKYIGILETDDYIPKNMYADLYQLAEEKDVDFIKTDFYRFTRNKGRQNNTYNKLYSDESYYNRVINPADEPNVFRTVLNIWSGIYNKSFLDQNHIDFNETPGASYQDNGFYFKTFCYAKRVYFLNKAYYMNRRDNPNSSVFDPAWGQKMIVEYDYIYDWFKTEPDLFALFKGSFLLKKYDNLLVGFDKIHDEEKLAFAHEFAEQMKKVLLAGQYDRKCFDNNKWRWLQMLVNNPEDFCNRRLAFYLERQNKMEKEKAAKLKELNVKMYQIEHSNTYRRAMKVNKFIHKIGDIIFRKG